VEGGLLVKPTGAAGTGTNGETAAVWARSETIFSVLPLFALSGTTAQAPQAFYLASPHLKKGEAPVGVGFGRTGASGLVTHAADGRQ